SPRTAMNHRTTLSVAALAVPALLAFDAPAEAVRFGPAEGTTLAKTFSSTSEMALDSMDMLMNGEPSPFPMEMDMTMTSETEVEVVDQYVGMGDGRPSKLERTFENIASNNSSAISNPMMGDMDIDLAAHSDLQGLKVVFTWDAEAGAYSPSFPEGVEADAELLEDLNEDMDLRALLPEGDVALDASWEVDPQALVGVLAPGGNLKLVPEESEELPMGNMPGSDMDLSDMLGEMSGDVTCTFVGTREVDGKRLGAVKVVVDVTSTNDLSDMIGEMMEDAPDMGAEIEFDSMDVEWSFEGEGELLWDLAGGHLHAFELTGDVVMAMDMAMNMSMQGQNMSIEQSLELSGSMALVAGSEAR
ncbi:MAG TPA: hypothetical protein VJP77_07685, partial [Planctomycetota bacterium]|nr:hypothetical protein [Planctomycetota bacterium]